MHAYTRMPSCQCCMMTISLCTIKKLLSPGCYHKIFLTLWSFFMKSVQYVVFIRHICFCITFSQCSNTLHHSLPTRHKEYWHQASRHTYIVSNQRYYLLHYNNAFGASRALLRMSVIWFTDHKRDKRHTTWVKLNLPLYFCVILLWLLNCPSIWNIHL